MIFYDFDDINILGEPEPGKRVDGWGGDQAEGGVGCHDQEGH